MRRLALLVLLAGCAGIESDIERAEIGFFFENFIKGKDRGLYEYSKMIEEHSTKVQGGRYQYNAPAHISNFYIERAVCGLGGTKIPNSDHLAAVADKLLYVLVFDPTGAMRSTACEQLGRVLLPLPKSPLLQVGFYLGRLVEESAAALLCHRVRMEEGGTPQAWRVQSRLLYQEGRHGLRGGDQRRWRDRRPYRPLP